MVASSFSLFFFWCGHYFIDTHVCNVGLPWWVRWLRTCLVYRRPKFSPWVRKIPWRREWLPTQVILPEEFTNFRETLY